MSNERADIIRMLNSAFDGVTGNTDDYWPQPLRARIKAINDRVYDTVNNGVYKAGFATAQEAYDKAVRSAVRQPGRDRGAAGRDTAI